MAGFDAASSPRTGLAALIYDSLNGRLYGNGSGVTDRPQSLPLLAILASANGNTPPPLLSASDISLI